MKIITKVPADSKYLNMGYIQENGEEVLFSIQIIDNPVIGLIGIAAINPDGEQMFFITDMSFINSVADGYKNSNIEIKYAGESKGCLEDNTKYNIRIEYYSDILVGILEIKE